MLLSLEVKPLGPYAYGARVKTQKKRQSDASRRRPRARAASMWKRDTSPFCLWRRSRPRARQAAPEAAHRRDGVRPALDDARVVEEREGVGQPPVPGAVDLPPVGELAVVVDAAVVALLRLALRLLPSVQDLLLDAPVAEDVLPRVLLRPPAPVPRHLVRRQVRVVARNDPRHRAAAPRRRDAPSRRRLLPLVSSAASASLGSPRITPLSVP